MTWTTQYLLVPRIKSDKSKFLAQIGFTLDNPHDLEQAIRQIIRNNDAIQDRINEYGIFYQVSGTLYGPEGDSMVITIWLYASSDQTYRFITLKPKKD